MTVLIDVALILYSIEKYVGFNADLVLLYLTINISFIIMNDSISLVVGGTCSISRLLYFCYVFIMYLLLQSNIPILSNLQYKYSNDIAMRFSVLVLRILISEMTRQSYNLLP